MFKFLGSIGGSRRRDITTKASDYQTKFRQSLIENFYLLAIAPTIE
jgi:hypothetical protein